MSLERFKARSTKINSHLEHLKGKNLEELNKMFPDAKLEPHECDFNDLDHGISMEHTQRRINDERKGRITVSYRVGDTGDITKDWDNATKIFHWYNGEKWVELKQ